MDVSNLSPETHGTDPTTPSGSSGDEDGGEKGVIDLSERVIGAWEPAPLPPIGPDGAPIIPPPVPMTVLSDADWLCLRGPCRNYHRMVLSMDAAQPLDGTEGDDFRKTIHTCYPAPGIEMPLNEHVVYECSRWDPEDPRSSELVQIRLRREDYEQREQAELDVMIAAPSAPSSSGIPPADLSPAEQAEYLEQRGVEVTAAPEGAQVWCGVHRELLETCPCPKGEDAWLEYRALWVAARRHQAQPTQPTPADDGKPRGRRLRR